jgi:hypothetical protein
MTIANHEVHPLQRFTTPYLQHPAPVVLPPQLATDRSCADRVLQRYIRLDPPAACTVASQANDNQSLLSLHAERLAQEFPICSDACACHVHPLVMANARAWAVRTSANIDNYQQAVAQVMSRCAAVQSMLLENEVYEYLSWLQDVMADVHLRPLQPAYRPPTLCSATQPWQSRILKLWVCGEHCCHYRARVCKC